VLCTTEASYEDPSFKEASKEVWNLTRESGKEMSQIEKIKKFMVLNPVLLKFHPMNPLIDPNSKKSNNKKSGERKSRD